jgi:hypothetical protein
VSGKNIDAGNAILGGWRELAAVVDRKLYVRFYGRLLSIINHYITNG